MRKIYRFTYEEAQLALFNENKEKLGLESYWTIEIDSKPINKEPQTIRIDGPLTTYREERPRFTDDGYPL